MVSESKQVVAAQQLGRQARERTRASLFQALARERWAGVDRAWALIIGLGLADLILSWRSGLSFQG
jgi:hypothetical protein